MSAALSQRSAQRIRLGALALVLSGIVLVPVPLLQNVPTNPEQNVAFALGANTLAWRFSLVLAFIYFALLVLGSFALYARLARTRVERWAFAGLVVTVGFLVLYIPITGFAAYVVPAVGVLIEGGHADAVEVMEQTFREPFAAVSFLSGILYYVGIVLTGVAVWRSETLWRWGAALHSIGCGRHPRLPRRTFCSQRRAAGVGGGGGGWCLTLEKRVIGRSKHEYAASVYSPVADKACSRKLICSAADRYALRPGQRATLLPDGRGRHDNI